MKNCGYFTYLNARDHLSDTLIPAYFSSKFQLFCSIYLDGKVDNLVYMIIGEACACTCEYPRNLSFLIKRALLLLGEACTHEVHECVKARPNFKKFNTHTDVEIALVIIPT